MEDKWSVNSPPNNEKTVKKVRIIISSILVIAGGLILAAQLIPLGRSYVIGRILEAKDESLVSPVPGSYKREINGEFAYWDPGMSYFENLLTAAGATYSPDDPYYIQPTNRDIVIDENYNREMQITINALDINQVNVMPNVESYEEDIYNAVLEEGLAHFKGTSLPGDGGNAFIYGHSAVESYFTNHQNNPETIFSKLQEINIGDKVVVNKDGKDIEYVVRSKKIVEPTDFSVLRTDAAKETLTLMTCHPNGLGTNRLIVKADKKDG